MLPEAQSGGVFGSPVSACCEGLSGRSVEDGAAEDPGTIGERMKALDLGTFGSKAEGFGADAEVSGRFGQVKPGLDAIIGRAVDQDLVVRA